jgi:hypothetical protein
MITYLVTRKYDGREWPTRGQVLPAVGDYLYLPDVAGIYVVTRRVINCQTGVLRVFVEEA